MQSGMEVVYDVSERLLSNSIALLGASTLAISPSFPAALRNDFGASSHAF